MIARCQNHLDDRSSFGVGYGDDDVLMMNFQVPPFQDLLLVIHH